MLKNLFHMALIITLGLTMFASCGDGDDSNSESGNDDESADDDHDDDSVSFPDADSLLAAAGSAVITPTPENHPETVYLGGIFPPRTSTGVHDDLKACALILKQGDRQLVIVSLDFIGFTRTRIREIQERLEVYGFVKDHILIASTHTHEAPDTMGVFGPNVLTSGVSPAYMRFVQDTIVELALETSRRLTPVTMRAAQAPVYDPLSNFPTLTADSRQPEITVDYLSAAAFDDENGETVATLVNWHAHPEVMIESTLVSPDFPAWTRRRMETLYGGTCVYISGALGGLASPTGVSVPARDEDGQAVYEDGEPLYLTEGTWGKTRSLGFVVADIAADALDRADTQTPVLSIRVEKLLLPVDNLIMKLAFVTGLVEYDMADLDRDHPFQCGFLGCALEPVALIRLGNMALVTSPGETFPETVTGRLQSSVDFGAPWGEFTFPAMEGIDDFLAAEVPMHMSVCGDETGYIIPESDFHAPGHPDYYEEDLYFGRDTETRYRELVRTMALGG